MNCPRCGSPTKVSHSYADAHGVTQRRVCDGCGVVLVAETTIVAVDPKRGQGAAARARQRKNTPK